MPSNNRGNKEKGRAKAQGKEVMQGKVKEVMQGKVKEKNFVFDDDTSDSDEDLEVFRKSMQGKTGSDQDNLPDGASDSDSEGEEGGSDDGDGDDDDDDESSSDDGGNTAAVDNSERCEKLGRLTGLLDSLAGGGSNSSSEEEEESDDVTGNNGQVDRSEDESEEEEMADKDDNDVDDDDDDGDSSDGDYPQENPTDNPAKENKNPGAQRLGKRRKKDLAGNEEVVGGKRAKTEIAEKPPLDVEAERLQYRQNLAKMSVEQILKLKNSLGLKLFNQKWEGEGGGGKREGAGGGGGGGATKRDFKRENKNRPREMSSKKRVGKFNPAVQVSKAVPRDPRFDPLCGDFDKKIFRKTYKFVNEVKEKELGILRKKFKNSVDPEEKEKLKFLVQRTENQLRAEREKDEKEKARRDESDAIKEKLNRGEAHVYKSKRARQEEELVRTFNNLKEKGGLDNYIKKKTKANLAKDRKLMDKMSN